MQTINKPGLEFLKGLDLETWERLSEDDFPHPLLRKALIEHLYGCLYQRGDLSLRERLLVTIAALMSSGNMMPQLGVQLQIALKNGIKPEELMEVAFQISAFSGFANAINAAYVVDSVVDSVNGPSDESTRSSD